MSECCRGKTSKQIIDLCGPINITSTFHEETTGINKPLAGAIAKCVERTHRSDRAGCDVYSLPAVAVGNWLRFSETSFVASHPEMSAVETPLIQAATERPLPGTKQ